MIRKISADRLYTGTTDVALLDKVVIFDPQGTILQIDELRKKNPISFDIFLISQRFKNVFSAGPLEVNELTEAYVDSLAEGIIIAACLQYAQQQLANAPYFR